MSIRPSTAPESSRFGRLLVRVGVAIALTVVMALTSTVSFAAWTASTSKNATATPGTMALTSSGISGLDGQVYSATAASVTQQVTITNTGTVPFKLSKVGINSSGTLPLDLVTLKIWQRIGASCTPPTNPPSANLSSTSLALSSLNVTVAQSASAVLCASTTFTGDAVAQAGKNITSTLAFEGEVGTNWKVTDAALASERKFAQSVYQLAAPAIVNCRTSSYFGLWPSAKITWAAPASNSPIVRYDIYFNSGTTPIDTTTATNITISNIPADGNITVRAIAQNGAVSLESLPVPVNYTAGFFGGVSCV